VIKVEPLNVDKSKNHFLFIGGMGSGKTVAQKKLMVSWLLTNKNGKVYIYADKFEYFLYKGKEFSISDHYNEFKNEIIKDIKEDILLRKEPRKKLIVIDYLPCGEVESYVEEIIDLPGITISMTNNGLVRLSESIKDKIHNKIIFLEEKNPNSMWQYLEESTNEVKKATYMSDEDLCKEIQSRN
jgi:hypothetical protein